MSLGVTGTSGGRQELGTSLLPLPSFPLMTRKETQESGPFRLQMSSYKSKNPEVGVMWMTGSAPKSHVVKSSPASITAAVH